MAKKSEKNAAEALADLRRQCRRLKRRNDLLKTQLKNAAKKLKAASNELSMAQRRLNKDLEHARVIQQGLLPQDIEDAAGLSVGATYISAYAVGGDYYDVFQIAESVYGIVVADVSGHGVSSALIMSMVKVLLKAYAGHQQGPQATLEHINETFLSEIRTENFVSAFYGILDITNHTLTYSSAGHCPALFFNKKNGEHSQVKADGMFLGAFNDMMLKEKSLTYAAGTQRILLYTDGLIEAKNADGDMFEISRLKQAGRDTLRLPPRKATKKILKIQKDFCGGNTEPTDDITLLVIDV
jgi:sigma-B regulation protein RsbU (phosphoserine phosphatase)